MPNITHDELRQLWIEQRKQYDEWQVALVKNAYALRNRIEEILDAPEKWNEPSSGIEHRYVEVVSLTAKKAPRVPSNLMDEISPVGILPFGVSITLDVQENSYPKALVHLPVAVRFMKKQAEFCLWNTDTDEKVEHSNWKSNIETFAEDVISAIAEYVKHDPHDGFEKKTQIGFIQT